MSYPGLEAMPIAKRKPARCNSQLGCLATARSGWATKLMASKRPRLMPVIDSVVTAVLKPPGGRFWVPMRNQLADAERRRKIAKVVSCAPDNVTLLRRIDVAVWMYGSTQSHTTKRGEA